MMQSGHCCYCVGGCCCCCEYCFSTRRVHKAIYIAKNIKKRLSTWAIHKVLLRLLRTLSHLSSKPQWCSFLSTFAPASPFCQGAFNLWMWKKWLWIMADQGLECHGSQLSESDTLLTTPHWLHAQPVRKLSCCPSMPIAVLFVFFTEDPEGQHVGWVAENIMICFRPFLSVLWQSVLMGCVCVVTQLLRSPTLSPLLHAGPPTTALARGMRCLFDTAYKFY